MDGQNACRFTDKKFQNHQNTVDLAGTMQGPVVVIDMSQVGQTQAEACEKLEEKKEPDHKKAARDAGIPEEDFEAIKQVMTDNNALVSFRDTNKSCLSHLQNGVPSKGHDVLTKTFEASNLPPDRQDMAGLVSTLTQKPPAGQIVENPQLVLQNGSPLTGDYDMHDLITSSSGNRVRGGSAKENRLIDRMNRAIAGDREGWPDRVKHGAQGNYGDFATKSGEDPVTKLFQPDPPVTAIDAKAKPPDTPPTVYRLKTNEDIVNMYRCKGTNMPDEWNLRAGSETGPRVSAKLP
jgi:hypothetical protein